MELLRSSAARDIFHVCYSHQERYVGSLQFIDRHVTFDYRLYDRFFEEHEFDIRRACILRRKLVHS